MQMIRKWLAVGLILLFIGTAVISSNGQKIEEQFLLGSRGNILYVGGSGPGNYTRIQDAIDNASDGQTVFVYHSSTPYYENIIIDKSIRLIGEDRNTTIIDGNGLHNVTLITADNVIISGLTLYHSGDYHLFGYMDSGVFILSNGNTIDGNIIKRNLGCGITARNSKNNTIRNNVIAKNAYYGAELINFTNNRFENNTISESGLGIDVESGCENNISNNVFSDLDYSVSFNGCINNSIFHNKLNGHLHSVSMYYNSNNNVISENTFDNEIENVNNLWIVASFNNAIVRNNFFTVGYTVCFAASSNNVWDGNYWGHARLLPKVILGKNGQFDRYPNTLNFDWHPAHKPYDIGR